MSERAFTHPSDDALTRAARDAMAPLRAVVRPAFFGMDRVPDERPLLFVGNHTLYGVLDVPFLWAELWEKRGIYLRGLGDHLHFRVPLWRGFVRRFGAVEGTRPKLRALFDAGEHVLVFPGGAREVAKRKGEKYTLVWKERLGFARLAIEYGVTIVPFAAVGIEDAFDVVYDADDLYKTPVGGILEALRVRKDIVPPVALGLGPTLLPRPERLYFHFGEPVETRHLKGREGDDEVCRGVRDAVKREVEQGIALMREERERDPERGLMPRVARALKREGGGR